MENKELLEMLNDFYEKEHSLRNLTKSKDSMGHTLISGPDLLKEEYNWVVCFMLYIYFKGILFISEGWNEADVERCIKNSDIQRKDEVLTLWSSLVGRYPYMDKLGELLIYYNFHPFTSEEDERTLANWANQKYLFNSGFFISTSYNEEVAFDVLTKCQKQLGINLEKGKILVSNCALDLIGDIISNSNKETHYYFYGCKDSENTVLAIAILLLDCYKNMSIIPLLNLESQLPDKGEYDVVFLNAKKGYNSLHDSKILDYVSDNGCAIVFNLSNEYLGDEFYEYEVPVMFDNIESNIIAVKKTKDETKIVRYGEFFVNNMFDEYSYWIEKLTEYIKNSISNDDYQILKKEDFKNTSGVKFNAVKRLKDQLDFVWIKKSDIVSVIEDKEEWLDNAEIDEDKIITSSKLSNDPFKITADNSVYLHGFINKSGDAPHPLEECVIKRNSNYDYYYKIPGKYAEIFTAMCESDNRENGENETRFNRYLCCRLVEEPCLFYSWRGIMRVNATKQDPVCFRKCHFYFDEETGIECIPDCDIIKINPNYDENFIIYQLLNQHNASNTNYILVAPTKEEQHTYYLNKRLDRISVLKPVLDEMEDEVQKSIAESPAYITGVGFQNFRRFSNLPVLNLSGVNILVGANNAGKSTLVKGMLLAFDNIKNLLVDDSDNGIISPSFQYDANNYHDVHVGTFDRCYSYNPIVWKNEPKRRTMSFSICCAHFVIEITVEPASKDAGTSVPISEILVEDRKRQASFLFDYKNMKTSAIFNIAGEKVNYNYTGLSCKRTKIGENQIPTLIRGIVSEIQNPHFLKDATQIAKLEGKSGFILEIADELERVIRNINIEYIYAHGINQKVLFNYNDKNDYMAQTLHDLIIEKIGTAEHDFICHWLNELELGNDYDVHSIGGEAYIIQIRNNAGNMTYLADMGMGSNQLVILILRLAIIIHHYRILEGKPYRPTIIIEEPEQNIHPKFQSKLALLFHEVHSKYGFNFIVETHSEYLVRKSQVIVAQQKYKDDEELKKNNPFKVYFFPSNRLPYEMLYRTDGNFSNEFDSGFFDEANKLLFDII